MGFRILVIEDNENNLKLMTYLLKASGHSILVAIDGLQGFEAARREKPDLIVCDIQMPVMSGYEVAIALQNDPDVAGIPRIAVSALAMMGDRDKILAAGFDGYIAKPIIPRSFVSQVESYLNGTPGPRWQRSAAGAGNGNAAPPKRIGPTILVVDDSPNNLSLARSILEPSGYRVVEATNAHEAFAEACRNRPALILCDVHMPGGDGFECIGKIKADPGLAGVPFVFISSAVFGEEVRRKCLDLGAMRFIGRPVKSQVLLGEIQDVLRESEKLAAPGLTSPER